MVLYNPLISQKFRIGGIRGVWKMWIVEKCRVWKMRSAKSRKCGVWKMRSVEDAAGVQRVENTECRKCGD